MDAIQVGRPASMRQLNKRIVLEIIKRKKHISKIELSRETGLKPPTIANIINELLKENLILYHGKGKDNRNGGPKPDLYRVNYQNSYFIGIDLDMNGINGVITDMGSNIIQKTFKISNYSSQDILTKDLKTVINFLINESKVEPASIKGIGVALTALVDSDAGIIKASSIDILITYDMKGILEKEYSIKVYIDNDINLLAAGQKWPELNGREAKNILYLGIREGVGLGTIIDGKLYKGSEGMSSNISCFSNAKGNSSIVKNVKNKLGIEDMDINKICCAIQNNDRTIIEIVRKSFYELGILTGMLIQLFNPECIVICNQILNYSDELFEYMVNISRDFCSHLPYTNLQYAMFPLEDHSIAYNAAQYILKEFNNNLYQINSN